MASPAREEGRGADRAAPAETDAPTLAKPILGLFDVTMIVMGCIIGAGCFANPAAIAAQVGSSGWIFAIWGLGGVIALTGALVFAELSAMFPRTGGQYVFVREPFGRFLAFLFGWVLLAAIVSNAIAWVGRIFARHLALLFAGGDGAGGLDALGKPFIALFSAISGHEESASAAGEKVVAFLLIVAFTWLNVRGLRLGATVQNVAMVAKLLGIVAVIALGAVAIVRGEAFPADDGLAIATELRAARGLPPPVALAAGGITFAAFNAALFKAMFTYGGWQNAAAVGSEVKNAKRTLPLGILLGTVGVVALYLALNGALVAVLGPIGVAATGTPAADAAGRVVPGGELFVAALVMTSTFAITQALLMVTPRIYYAMAQDGLFFAPIGRLHPRYGTPALAIALQGLAATVHLLLGDLLDLLDMTTFFDWFGFTLCALGLFVLRRKRPELPRPYRAWGYPWLPGLFLLLSTWVFVFHFWFAEEQARQRSLWVFLVGLALYGAFEWSRRRTDDRKPHL